MKMKKIFGVILVLLLAVSFLAACCPLCDLPAEFRLTSIAISPSVPVNGTVTITAIVNNIGEQSGSCNVSLTIGNYADSKSVNSLASGESSNVSFSYTVTTEGNYTATVSTPNATMSKSFTVNVCGADGKGTPASEIYATELAGGVNPATAYGTPRAAAGAPATRRVVAVGEDNGTMVAEEVE